MSKLYPIGIQSFESLRKAGFCYVDKTALVYRLAASGRYYFLSRPRRFGKSLLVSTMRAYFEGKRELFEGLAMEELERDWSSYPVLHLDLNAREYANEHSLVEELNKHLEIWESRYGDEFADRRVEERFFHVIRNAYRQTGKPVVILVDEYDKPLLQTIGNPELQERYRNTLKPFYGTLKSMDAYIRFAFLTGVTRFGKVSVFSDLNNLNDLSMNHQFSDICGISERELNVSFKEDIQALAQTLQMSYEQTCETLKKYYDGYHFEEKSQGIYNPFSLLNAFYHKKISSYWFETGTPSYLVELLKRNHYELSDLEHEEVYADILSGIYSAEDNPISVIYQSGYLTIKGYDKEFGLYRLGFPNREVEEGFIRYLLPFYAGKGKPDSTFEIHRFVREIRAGHIDAFLNRLRSFFADIPYELLGDLERHYQNVLFILFKLIGFYVHAEYRTASGRIDLTLQTDRYIYIMEFKLDGSADEALRQIDEKGYALPFASDSRKLLKIGINFDKQTRGMGEWKIVDD